MHDPTCPDEGPDEDALAVAAKTSLSTIWELWACREDDVRKVVAGGLRKWNAWHFEDDANAHARVVFVTSAVPSYDPTEGYFWPHAAQRVWSRVNRWLANQIREGTDAPDQEPEIDGGSVEPGSTAPLFADLAARFDAIQDDDLRIKLLVVELLRATQHSTSQIATTLALDAVNGYPNSHLAATWPYFAGRVIDRGIPSVPPPLPESWMEVVTLFCPTPPGSAKPTPPDPALILDPATQERALHSWHETFRKYFNRARAAHLKK